MKRPVRRINARTRFSVARLRNHVQPRSWLRRSNLDLLFAAMLLLGALVAVAALPLGHMARVALTLPMLLLVPGYLLVQCLVAPERPVRKRLQDALFGLGLSPAVVGLAALVVAIVPGGFTATAIITSVLVGTLLLGLGATLRRAGVAEAAPDAA